MQQQGYLSIIASILIVLASIVSLAVVHSYSDRLLANTLDSQAQQALFLAEAGMERASHFLQGNASTPLACSNSAGNPLTGNANVTNATYAASVGQFTVNNNDPSGEETLQTSATLTQAVSATDSNITVSDATSYQSNGWLLIGNEMLQYTHKDNAHFYGLTRGLANTQARGHAVGARVIQQQCSLLSTGAVPSFANPQAVRRITFATAGSQEGWAVGNNQGSNVRVVRWNDPSADTWNYQTVASFNKQLNGISIINHYEAWAVGKRLSGPTRFFIMRWDGSTWALSNNLPVTSSNGAIKDLSAVSSVSSTEAWAVGKRSSSSTNRRYTILHWDGSSWCLLGPNGDNCSSVTIPITTARDLNAIEVIDSNDDGVGDFGFAVGKNSYFLRFNGSTWSEYVAGGNELLAVSVLSTQEAWAVGKAGTMFKWNGSRWALQFPALAGGAEWRGIAMLDSNHDGFADEGWIVGKSNRAAHYIAGTWQDQNTSGMGHLNAVAMFTANDVWAVADGGDMAHWDGSAWTRVLPPAGANQHLRAIDVLNIAPSSGAWHEQFA